MPTAGNYIDGLIQSMGTLKTMERQETPGMKRRLVNLADSDNDEEVKPPIAKKKRRRNHKNQKVLQSN